ncbi:unnamed protein product, partial [Closterium sp. NIES-53]
MQMYEKKRIKGLPLPSSPTREQMYEKKRIKGWSFAAKLENQTNKDWQRAVFCVCPPGHSQWTSRPFK